MATLEEIRTLIKQELNNLIQAQNLDYDQVTITIDQGTMTEQDYLESLKDVFVMAVDYRGKTSQAQDGKKEYIGKPIYGNLDANGMLKVYGFEKINKTLNDQKAFINKAYTDYVDLNNETHTTLSDLKTAAERAAYSAGEAANVASTKAGEAATSAGNAQTSEGNASKSASEASTSAQTASTKACEATTAAGKAKTSEENASTAATNAQNAEKKALEYKNAINPEQFIVKTSITQGQYTIQGGFNGSLS